MAGIRMHPKNAVHFITNRCEQEQFLLLPSKTTNSIVLSWLVKALFFVNYGIEIYAFICLSNHIHLLLRDIEGKLAQFMCYFEANVARAMNRELGRRGKFWAREYDDVIVDGEDEFLDRYAYVVCNAVKAGLVDKAEDWTGLNSLSNALSGEPYRVEVLNKTKLHNATRRGQKVDRRKFIETFEFSLTIPPMWEDLSVKDRASKIRELVKSGEKEYRQRREGKPALGMRKIATQKPPDRPKNPAFRPRIKVFCFDKERRKELLNAYRLHVGAYREIWDGFVKAAAKGKRPAIEWPAWSYPPSSWTPIGYAKAA